MRRERSWKLRERGRKGGREKGREGAWKRGGERDFPTSVAANPVLRVLRRCDVRV
jgi:hypothetical protein